MMRRFFLSTFDVVLVRKAIIVREPRVRLPPLRAPFPSPSKEEESERRARAMASFILKRAGINPLLPALAALVIAYLPDDAHAQVAQAQAGSPASPSPSPVRATALATARAVILPSSARIEQGRISRAQPGMALAPQPQRRTRPCDAATSATNPACRMIVYDLP
jgi:hypothetical protein